MTTQTVTEQLRDRVLAAGESCKAIEQTALDAGVAYGSVWKLARNRGGIDAGSVDRLATHFGLRLTLKPKRKKIPESS